MELRKIIEEGIEKLEEIADVRWPKSNSSYITKDKLIIAIEKAILQKSEIWKTLGYKHTSGYSGAINKIITNKPNTKMQLKKYILYIVGYKYCYSCNTCKILEEFNNDKNDLSGKSSQCSICINNYYSKNKKEIINNRKIYREDNKEELKIKRLDKRKETVLHIIDVMIREGKLPECSICGYKENWAVLEFHHINPDLERPEWSYDKKGKKRAPASYILGCKRETAEKRYLKEINNLELLCGNCHQKEHFTGSIDNQKGTKKALEKLGYQYVCAIKGCGENTFLHLHHNSSDDKSVSFADFSNLSENRILIDNTLENEMKKETIILCKNHHMDTHNKDYNYITGIKI